MGSSKTLLLPILFLFLTAGCAQPPEQARTPTEAQQKLIRLCKEEYNLDIVTKRFDNTLWIYLPLDNSYLFLTASKEGPHKSKGSEEKTVLKYIDGDFQEGAFHLDYDISPSKGYTDSRGINTRTTEEYSKKQQFLFSAINRAYGDIEKLPGSNRYAEKVPGDVTFLGEEKNATHQRLVRSYVKADAVPDFFVVVIADIQKGIETRMYLYLQDLRRAFYDPGFGEEYIKRVVTDQPIGHDIIIGDKTGTHLNAYDLTWPAFLMKQMIYRATLKYTFSSIPPLADTRRQLVQIAAETVRAYHFNDFRSLQLNNLNTNTSETVGQAELQTVQTAPPTLPGKLHTITFETGAPPDGDFPAP